VWQLVNTSPNNPLHHNTIEKEFHKNIHGGENMVNSSMSFSNNVLTHYHKMPDFDALKIYSCGQHCEKSRNSL
jgi:hypothetical protein